MSKTLPRALVLGCAVGLAAFFGGRTSAHDVAADPSFVARARAHYAQVGRELASADVSALDPSRRAARARALESLASYRDRGDFGVNLDVRGARVPEFVDVGGRRCAVAELLHCTGDDSIVTRVAGAANRAWIADLAEDGELLSWLDRNGLSVEDAARIQGPAEWPPAAAAAKEPDEQQVDAGGDGSGGTDDGASSGARGGRSGGTSGAGGSSAGASAGADVRHAGAGRTPGGGAPSWVTWWEFSKLEFIRVPRVDATRGGYADAARCKLRAQAVAAFSAALSDRDPAVRSAAVVALGRVEGEVAVARIEALLDDSDAAVRERAVLALGASGSPGGARILAAIVRDGTVGARRRTATPETRGLALVALGLARRCGLDAAHDVDAAGVLATAPRRGLADVGAAAFVHDLLAGSKTLGDAAVRAARDADLPDAARGRAVESLGRRDDDRDAAAALRDVVGDRRVDVRRSAAVAMGERADPLVAAQAATAYELETEPLARGLLLVSLARTGAPRATSILTSALADGPTAERPWAALALGLVARRTGDAHVRDVLLRADVATSARPALRIAQGLAGGGAAVLPLADALVGAADPSERFGAATGLGLIGGDDARVALLRALPVEKSEHVRVAIAWSLGVIGDAADAPVLLHVVESLEDPGLDGLAAVALALHGSDASVEGAVRACAAARRPAARAAAIEAAGFMFSRSPGLVLSETSRRTNFAVMPGWLRRALLTTL